MITQETKRQADFFHKVIPTRKFIVMQRNGLNENRLPAWNVELESMAQDSLSQRTETEYISIIGYKVKTRYDFITIVGEIDEDNIMYMLEVLGFELLKVKEITGGKVKS